MASKPLYTVVAVAGIAAASAAAWWWQNKPAKPAGDQAAVAAPRAAASGAASPGGPGAPARPPAVEVARVEVVRLVDTAQAVGTLRSRQSVMLRPEVSGRIAKLNFRDGERVRKGQLLVQFDDDLPRAQVAQAQAELSIARANHKRNQELVAQGFISQRSVDESGAALQVAQAKLQLAEATAERLRIIAPFDGVAGIRNVNIGDYLKDGADIVNIEDLDAVLVDFRLPERFQPKLRRGQSAMVSFDALPGRRYTAVVQAVDPLVDANGRSVGVRGCIDNRKLELRPGMFARITAVFGERENARVIPEEALVPQGGRQVVFKVVDGPDQDSKTVRRIEVKPGLRQPGRVEILEGLEPGDTVVTAGHQRLQRDGMPVRVVDLARLGQGGAGGRPSGPGGPGGPGAGGGPAGPGASASAAPGAAASAPAGAAPAPAGGPPAAAAPATAQAQAAARAPQARPAPAGPNPCVALGSTRSAG